MLSKNRDDRKHRLQPMVASSIRIVLTVDKLGQGYWEAFGAKEELKECCGLNWSGNAATSWMDVQSVETLNVVVTEEIKFK